MRISFIIYGLASGGAERAVTGLANYWASHHSVSIITLVKTEPFYPLDDRVRLHYCLEKSKISTTPLQSIKDGGLRIKRLIYWLRKEKPEVVISFMMKTNIYAILACKWIGIPCIGSERANHELNRLPKLQEFLRNFSYKFINALVVQTEGNSNFYGTIMQSNKIHVIPNAIASVLKTNRENNRTLKEKIILNVGAFRDGKAQNVLIKAFAQLPKSDWRLFFLGNGPNLKEFKALSLDLGIAHRISFEGAQKDVASYYNKASMFVFTSEHEGFPNALLEALYYGLPSISTNCPHGPADMITNGTNGFLVPINDVNALTKKMNLLILDDDLRESFSKRAIESTKKYEMEPIAQKWMVLMKSVL